MTLGELREENRRLYDRDVRTPGYERDLLASNARYIPALEVEVDRLRNALHLAYDQLARLEPSTGWERAHYDEAVRQVEEALRG